MPRAANSSSASASGGGGVIARAWNYVFGLVEEDEGYGSEGEDGLVGPIGGREEGEGNSKPYMRPKEFYMAIGEGLMNCDLSHEPKPKRLCVSKKTIVGHRGMPAREAVCITTVSFSI